MSELVAVERHGPACVLRLQRERKLNAISTEVEGELIAALERPECKQAACVVITGSARAFSAGADLSEISDASPESIHSYYLSTGEFAERIADLPQPTFSAISGWCLGGGFELALATDFRIAEESATFGLPEVSIGINPSSGGTHRLVKIVGPARAKELILLRDRLDAAEAYRLGVVTEIVSEGQALARALEHCERIAGLPQLAVQIVGRTIDVAAESSRQAALELERLAYMALSRTSEPSTEA
ncbi:MAG TPA: enoyl-CoA hydratase/isomerase family protein [Solirubrobacteraceae bacterium]|nr:enoyl-CoA hydratase/isomerase family protein [Solirubrobacteraceae bacterium]